MPLAFDAIGTKDTTSFSGDPDPNATPPADDRVYEIPDRAEHGAIANGLRAYFVFANPSGPPNIDGTLWVHDDTAAVWVKAVDITGIENYNAIQVPNVAPGRIFFQITALNGGTADSVSMFGTAF
jgi:hypothetical protein